MGGNGPQDRAGKRKTSQDISYLLLLRPAWKGFELPDDYAAEGTSKPPLTLEIRGLPPCITAAYMKAWHDAILPCSRTRRAAQVQRR
jgi:hypothetical protein